METIEAIHTRRSIRQFTDKKVPRDLVDKILKAAMMAPSAGNNMPWHFVVIDEPAILKKIAADYPNAAMASQASVAILICGKPEVERFVPYWIQDCSAAMQNLLLATHDLGLGATWTAVYPREERLDYYRHLFNIPKDVFPMGLVPIGFPAVKSERVDRYKPKRVHHNKW